MVVIVSTYKTQNTTDNNDAISATGVIAIVALTSITKVESLIKKIFGLNSSIADEAMKPPHGLGASLMAMQLGKRIFDNVGKVGHGAAEMIGAGRDKKKAATRYARNLAVLNNKAASQNKPSASALPNAEDNALPPVKERGIRKVSADELRSIGSATSPQRVSNNETTASAPDPEKMLKIQEKYEDDLAAAKKRRAAGAKKILSGMLETGGAGAGLIAGGSLGLVGTLATGDTPAHAIKAAVSGMGIGDAAGEKATNLIAGIDDHIIGGIKGTKSTNKAYDAALTAAEKSLGMQQQTVKSRKERLNNIQKQVKTIQEMNQNRDAGSI